MRERPALLDSIGKDERAAVVATPEYFKRYAKPTPSRLVATDTKQKLTSEVQAAIIGLAD